MSPPDARAWPPVADLHCDTVGDLLGGADLARNPEGHVDLPRLRQGGVGLQVFACFVAPVLPADRAFHAATTMLDEIDLVCRQHSAKLRKVETAAQAETAAGAALTGVMAAVENGYALENDLSKLEQLRRRGVRYMTLTHARHVDWAASSGEPWTSDEGLTAYGRDVVREMNTLGMIVDVSHVHARTLRDVARCSRKPFIASHSCAAALCATERNLADEDLRTIAGAGGMVGVNFFPGFLDPARLTAQGATLGDLFHELEEIERRCAEDPTSALVERRRLHALMRDRAGPLRTGVDDVVSHIEHIAATIGDDHVGFGSDFDGVPELPLGITGCDAFPRILERLSARGFGPESIRKIAWDNFMRVLRANED